MTIETGEIKIWESITDHGCRSSVRVVVKTRNYRALLPGASHFSDRAEVVAAVEIWRAASDLSLRVNEMGHGIAGVAKFATLHPAPNEFPSRLNSTSCLLYDLHHTAQTVVTELSPIIRPSVIDSREPVSSVPFEDACRAVIN